MKMMNMVVNVNVQHVAIFATKTELVARVVTNVKKDPVLEDVLIIKRKSDKDG